MGNNAFDFGQFKVYKTYPSLIPYVGEQYSNAKKKILLIGESHYAHDECETRLDGMASLEGDDILVDIEAWYSGTLLGRLPQTNSLISNKGSYNTIGVVEKYLTDDTLDRSYHIFEYPAKIIAASKVVADVTLSPKETVAYMAFMNYFQRPAFQYGKSIEPKTIDLEIAYHNLMQVIDLIKPDVIIFASKLAYISFKKYDTKNVKCYKIPHPCCAWWNRKTKSGYNGPKYLTEILEENV